MFQQVTRLKTARNSSTEGFSFLGFEMFDLLIVLVQAIVVFSAIPLDWFFAHPMLRFIAGTGFFVSLYYLSQTKQYALGVRMIGKFHESLWFAIIVGGAIVGALVFAVFIVGPTKDLLNMFGVTDMSILTLVAIPFGVVCLGIIPYVAVRADEKLEASDQVKHDVQEDGEVQISDVPQEDFLMPVDESGRDETETNSISMETEDCENLEFLDVSIGAFYFGRAFFLLMATALLFYVEKVFEGNSDDIFTRLFLSTFMLSIFYIPVRIQEMFLRHQGPYFQSLFQTIIAVAMLKSSFVFF